MMRAKPIVVADVPCHHELFKDGFNGLFYKPTSTKDFCKKITFLSNNISLLNKISNNAWLKSDHFTYDKRVLDIFKILEPK